MSSAYRTISEPAVMVIAGVIPVAFLAMERKAIYRRKGKDLREVVAREELQRTLTEWHLSWHNEPRGKWTARLIDKLITSLPNSLVGMEVFSLTCTGLGRRVLLIVCSAMVWRTTLNTPFSLAKRWLSSADTGEFSPDMIVRKMLKSAGSWNRAAHYVRGGVPRIDNSLPVGERNSLT